HHRNTTPDAQVHQIGRHIHEGSGIMDVARESFVKNGNSMFRRHRQSDLDERITFSVFLVVSEACQLAALAMEISVGNVVDYSVSLHAQDPFDILEDRAL